MLGRKGENAPEGHGDAARRYKMKEKIVGTGDDCWIEDSAGNRAFRVDGELLRLHNTLLIKNREGEDLYKIQEWWLHIRDTIEIEYGSGNTAAIIKKALITPLHDRWTITMIGGGPDMKMHGNILDHEYRIEAGRDRVAEVSKKWFQVQDAYGIEVEPGYDDALILTIAAAIDQIPHDP
jgi:uncharacterized protein YxjI